MAAGLTAETWTAASLSQRWLTGLTGEWRTDWTAGWFWIGAGHSPDTGGSLPISSSASQHRCHGSVRTLVRGSRFDTISVQQEEKIYNARFLFIYFEQTVFFHLDVKILNIITLCYIYIY